MAITIYNRLQKRKFFFANGNIGRIIIIIIIILKYEINSLNFFEFLFNSSFFDIRGYYIGSYYCDVNHIRVDSDVPSYCEYIIIFLPGAATALAAATDNPVVAPTIELITVPNFSLNHVVALEWPSKIIFIIYNHLYIIKEDLNFRSSKFFRL